MEGKTIILPILVVLLGMVGFNYYLSHKHHQQIDEIHAQTEQVKKETANLSKQSLSEPVQSDKLDKITNEIKNTDIKDLPENKTWQKIAQGTQNTLGNNPSDAEVDAYLQREADVVRKKLPIDAGDGLTMTQITPGHKSVIYDYQTNQSVEPRDDIDIEAAKKELIRQNRMCESMGFILKYGVTVTYQYHGANNSSFVMKIAPSDCGF